MLCMAGQLPKGSLCNGNIKVTVGLPPDAVVNMDVVSSKVLFSKGQRLVLEYEQAATWSVSSSGQGTLSFHVKFKLIKNRVLPRFEGCWKVAIDPLFVDEETCFPTEPKTFADYYSCTNSKGKIGSVVQITRPPRISSWKLWRSSSNTMEMEMLITNLLAEAARIRRDFNIVHSNEDLGISVGINEEQQVDQIYMIL
ncbi:hypothetical protein SLEP1_g32710 [Rubroshorea leprosula]|uniref:DUF220 domain-containing protein n=1 Tax=Rubroshorea leprosula TaxID=152421 RepID=A0AAV5KEC8_9ROSI|nr:hypothetical protein SLEP1_g32710 [Rubroshorea leprosula]